MASLAVGVEASYRPGSKADFDRLYQASYQRIYRTLITIVGNPTAAEDCTQETFLRAFRAWPRWKGDAPAEAWLHRIALNTAISHRRRELLREVGELVRRLGRPGQPDPTEAGIVRSDLVQALHRLPPKQAAVLVLRHLHGYSNREIAAATGVPESTIASRLAEARRAMRARLAAYSISDTQDSPGVLHSK